MRVIQGIVVHGRPKIVLDQLRQGLNTLGFGDKMVQHPDLFEELFMKNHKEIQAQDVLDVFEFPLKCLSEIFFFISVESALSVDTKKQKQR